MHNHRIKMLNNAKPYAKNPNKLFFQVSLPLKSVVISLTVIK